MPFVKVPQESFKIALVFRCCFVIVLFELGVADKGFAVFAPVLRLYKDGQWRHLLDGVNTCIPLTSSTPTLRAFICGSTSAGLGQYNR